MIYADLHIHIGQSLDGRAVKITAAKSLSLPNIIETAQEVKGLSLIGVVDAQSPGVRRDLTALLSAGVLHPHSGGGYTTGKLTLIPGTEIELKAGTGSAHFLAFFPALEQLERYARRLSPYVKNLQLSSQRAYLAVPDWLEIVQETGGIWLPAHAFTPHKGIYGNCCRRLAEVLPVLPQALEIGLSADRSMALSVSELQGVQLFSNSDAHSLPNIAREYNALRLGDNSFQGLEDLFAGRAGEITGNYGLPPIVGKYHRTYCLVCEQVVEEEPPRLTCPRCGSSKVVMGVLDRLRVIADRIPPDDFRYHYQVPLSQLPGIGPKTYAHLLNAFGTEMAVLHDAPEGDLARAGGEKAAYWIMKARSGELNFSPGGGGIFGHVKM